MKKTIIILRSIFFNISFILWSVVFSLSALFVIALPSSCTVKIAQIWSKFSLILLKYICNIDYHITGTENLPKDKHYIIASKHQSAWETVTFQALFYPSIFLFKKEILYIPFFGLAVYKSGSIPVNRGHGNKKMIMDLIKAFNKKLANKNIIIFPEGTRTLPNSTPDYKSGLSLITKGVKGGIVIPVAINSGKYWPKKSFIKYPGIIEVHILPPIITGEMSASEFQEKLVNSIEDEMKKI